MTQTATQEPQAPEVGELSDDTRKEIVALREGGMTLAELKARFPQLTSEQLREVLPAGNARERKARQAKAPKAKPEPKVEAPKPAPTPRYVEEKKLAGDLADRVLAARQVVGRNRLAELLAVTGSAVWRFEQGRIHPDEVDGLISGLDAIEKRIAAGDFVKAAAQPKAKQASKADLTHRVEVVVELVKAARGDKSITKAGLVDSLLAVLDPS